MERRQRTYNPDSAYERAVARDPRRKEMIPVDIRTAVYKRACGDRRYPICEYTRKPISSQEGYNFAHINHNDRLRGYNSVGNVLLMSRRGHLKQHLDSMDDPSVIGLTPDQNNFGIEHIYEAMNQYERDQLDREGIDIHNYLPKPVEKTSYQRWLERNPNPETAVQSVAQLFEVDGEEPKVEDRHGERMVALTQKGIPIPGLPQQEQPVILYVADVEQTNKQFDIAAK